MSQRIYQRTVAELRELASMFWPAEISEEAEKASVIPMLLATQDVFIAILSVPFPNLEDLFHTIKVSALAGNVFLKHLTILADFGGEQLQRVNANFSTLFPSGALEYTWKGQPCSYTFQQLPVTNLTNDRLSLTGKRLFQERVLDPLLHDVAMLLIFGSVCREKTTATVLKNCEISQSLGQPEDIARFIKQRYICVSRITMGSRSNDLGQLAQKFVLNYLRENLRIDSVKIASKTVRRPKQPKEILSNVKIEFR